MQIMKMNMLSATNGHFQFISKFIWRYIYKTIKIFSFLAQLIIVHGNELFNKYSGFFCEFCNFIVFWQICKLNLIA